MATIVNIEAEVMTQAEPASKVFTFPGRKTEGLAPTVDPEPVQFVAPVAEAPVFAEPIEAVAETAAQPVAQETAPTLDLDQIVPAADPDELLLEDMSILTPAPSPNPVPPTGGTRPWLSRNAQPAEAEKRGTRDGGTLFERMSSLARGAAKAQVNEEDPQQPRDPLDIPRFLNRQNNP